MTLAADSPLVPVLFALLAAALFGLQAVLARRSLAYVNAQTGAMITILTAATVFWLLLVWQLELAWFRSPAVWVFASNGLLHPMLSMLLSFEANRRMGATVSSTISSTTPLFATTGAVLLLGEALSLEILLGTLAVAAGIVVLSWARSGAQHWALTDLVFPTGAALVRAFNHVWAKFGLNLLAAPLLAATLSFTVSGTLSVAAYRLRTGRLPRGISGMGVFWCVLGGFCVTGAIFSMYTALAIGQVVVVSPVIASYPLFALLWSLLFRQERLSVRIGVGVVLVVGGVVLISVR